MTARKLAPLLKNIRGCTLCVDSPEGPPLPHQPRPVLQVSATARIGVFGQAPGVRVHASGQPFTDPSGDRLRRWLGIDKDIFYDKSRVAVIPMGFCFPGLDKKGGDLPPRKECAPQWRASLLSLLPNLECAVLVGRYAQTWHLGDKAERTLTATVKNWKRYAPEYYPTPHPSWRNNAWLKKNEWFEKDLLPELRRQVHKFI